MHPTSDPIYCTRWALSLGITPEYVTHDYAHSGGVAALYDQRGVFRWGVDIHRTKAEALRRAEELRVKKIAAARRLIERLEKLRFEN